MDKQLLTNGAMMKAYELWAKRITPGTFIQQVRPVLVERFQATSREEAEAYAADMRLFDPTCYLLLSI